MRRHTFSLWGFIFICLIAGNFSLSGASNCRCFTSNSLWEYNKKFSSILICLVSEDDWAYPYFVRSEELKNSRLSQPIYYSDYRHNFHICNDLLINAMGFKIDWTYHAYKYPPKKDIEEAKQRTRTLIEKNYVIDNQLREEFRKIYARCYSLGHNNRSALYDHGFLEFIEGNVEASIDCAEKYIVVPVESWKINN